MSHTPTDPTEAAAALVEAEPQAVRVKPLVWEDFADLEMIQNPHNSDDNLAIALCSYFEHRIDCPDGDEDGAELDESGCWKVWASEHTESVLRRIAAKANAAIELTPTTVDDSPASDPVSKTPTLDALAMRTAALAAVANFPRCQVASNIRRMLLMGQIDPLQGYVRKEDCLAYGAAIAALPLPDHAAALAEAMRLPEVKALVEAAEAVIRDFHGDNAIATAHLTKLRSALKGVK